MPFKDFDSARAEVTQEPLTFQVGGEQFTVALPLSGYDLLDIGKAALLAQSSDGVNTESVDMMRNFIASALGTDQAAHFEQVARATRIGLEEIMEIFSWIMEEGIGVPTQQQSELQPQSSSDTASLPGAA